MNEEEKCSRIIPLSSVMERQITIKAEGSAASLRVVHLHE